MFKHFYRSLACIYNFEQSGQISRWNRFDHFCSEFIVGGLHQVSDAALVVDGKTFVRLELLILIKLSIDTSPKLLLGCCLPFLVDSPYLLGKDAVELHLATLISIRLGVDEAL